MSLDPRFTLDALPDPRFRAAVRAMDAGDLPALEGVLAEHPELPGTRVTYGDGYFRDPYLLWFVAENPIRNGVLPPNADAVAAAIVHAARRAGTADLQPQLDYALGLVCSGRVPRECGVQDALVDVLVAEGARPDAAMLSALAHRERAAVERLLARGATLSLAVATATHRVDHARRLAPGAGAAERRLALAAAALHGDAEMLALLLPLVDPADASAYAPDGFHSHATPLHQAVDAGSLAAVRALVAAGADTSARDRLYDATPLEWAVFLERDEVAQWLRAAIPRA